VGTGLSVLFWAELFAPYQGGIEQLAARHVSAMQGCGHELVVVTSHDAEELPDEERVGGVRVVRLPFRAALRSRDAGLFVEARRRYARLRREFEPQLVHLFHVGPSAVFHLSDAGASEVPSLVTLHGEVLRGGVGGDESVLEKALRAADWVTGVSGAVLRAAQSMVPDITGRSSVVYSGLEEVSPVPGAPDRQHPLLLCVGRLVHDKGFDVALQGFALLAERFPDARVAIAGDGPQREALEAEAEALGVGERVQFMGWLGSQSVLSVMATASVVLMPSRREGLPLVAIQAAQMARPVIAADVGGLPEVVAHGVTGLVVPPEDSGALAQAVGWVLENAEAAEEMGRAARTRASALFSWDRYVKVADALYREIVGRNEVASAC
jgi:glycosyltransferase involved in cell wall biosynthesis